MAYSNMSGWPGRVWTEQHGQEDFYIRQMRNGKRYSASTRCSTLRAALREVRRG